MCINTHYIFKSVGFFPYGSFEMGKYTINDEQKFTSTELSLEDIVLYSSNIRKVINAQISI